MIAPAHAEAARAERPAVKRFREKDLVEVAGLYYDVMEEVHREKPLEIRRRFRDAFSFKQLEELIPKQNSVCRCAVVDGRVVGFILGFVNQERIGWIQWLCIGRSCRRRGIGTLLLRHAIQDFRAKGAYEVACFTYPEQACVVELFKSCGFRQMGEIAKTFFSTHVLYMVKHLRTGRTKGRLRTIKIAGNAGQGVNLLAQVLGKMLVALGKHVALDVVYPPSVRSGTVYAEILFSDYPIQVPFVERPDLLVLLSQPPEGMKLSAGKIIVDESLGGGNGYHSCGEIVSFRRSAEEEFRSPSFVNMIALGRILSHIGFPLEVIRFEDALPAKFRSDPNYEAAIKYGYSFGDFYM